MNILTKIGGVANNNSGGVAQQNSMLLPTSQQFSSNEAPQYSARSEYLEPEMSEEISYVYPGYDLSDGELDERNSDQIESSINALTFAFGKKKKKLSAKANNDLTKIGNSRDGGQYMQKNQQIFRGLKPQVLFLFS